MRNLSKKLSVMALCTVFAAMQVASAQDVLSGASINSTQGGFVNATTDGTTANLNFNGNAHVDWSQLNVANGERLNFNTVNGANGITVLNTVQNAGGKSIINGTVYADPGVAKLIIANPNGMIYGANSQIITAGDLMLTTKTVNPVMSGTDMTGYAVDNSIAATAGVVLQEGSKFNIGGTFDILAPTIQVLGASVTAGNGVKLTTVDGKNYALSTPVTSSEYQQGVKLSSVSINGDVYIVSQQDMVTLTNGGTINGDLNINSQGVVAVNYSNGGNDLNVSGDVNVTSNGGVDLVVPRTGAEDTDLGNCMYLRNTNVGGNVNMANSGGFLEVKDVNVAGDMNLTTTAGENSHLKHFVHVVGNNNVDGNLNIDALHNIHIGGYDNTLTHINDGSLTVGGDITAIAHEGSITTTVDTTANKVDYTSGTLNILADNNAKITANEYKFQAEHYIGSIYGTGNNVIQIMEQYLPVDNHSGRTYLNISGGDVTKIVTGENGLAAIHADGDMNVSNVNANIVRLASQQNDIHINENVKANDIIVSGQTKDLYVNLPERDYRLQYTDIKDTEVITINPTTEITYEMTDGDNGWNKGTQTADNTRLVVPAPVVPPTPDPEPTPGPEPTPVTPQFQDNDNVKILNNLVPTQTDVNPQAYTPVAFAADLDDEIDTGVRKNVDGSVTVVRPFTPTK